MADHEGEVLRFSNGTVEAAVSTFGATVDLFRFTNGKHLLLERGIYETADGNQKDRKTIICLPNFGPAPAESGLRQHGFGRELCWDVQHKTQNAVILGLAIPKQGTVGVPPAYNGLRSVVRYSFDEHKGTAVFTALLSLENCGDVPMHVAPGFHPYFPVPRGVRMLHVIQNESKRTCTAYKAPIDSLAGSYYDKRVPSRFDIRVQLGSTAILINSTPNMHELIYWSDAPKSYVCVEPTVQGNDFERPEAEPAPGTLLEPGGLQRYRTAITWPAAS